MDKLKEMVRNANNRGRKWLLAGAALGVAAIAVALALPWRAADGVDPVDLRAATTMADAAVGAPPAAQDAARLHYRFSVLPGGVLSREELARKIKDDHVAAAHYASFDVAR